MSISTILQRAVEHAEGTPSYDVLMLMLLKTLELGEGNDGMTYTYIKEAGETIKALLHDIDTETSRH
jgi:hypothetical protein